MKKSVGYTTIAFILTMALSLTAFTSCSQVAAKNTPIAAASVQDDVQKLVSKVLPDAYPEITIKKGIPFEWTLQVTEEDLNDCNNEIIIPAYKIEKKLQVGDNLITFTPEESGTFTYSCWMGMIISKIHVE